MSNSGDPDMYEHNLKALCSTNYALHDHESNVNSDCSSTSTNSDTDMNKGTLTPLRMPQTAEEPHVDIYEHTILKNYHTAKYDTTYVDMNEAKYDTAYVDMNKEKQKEAYAINEKKHVYMNMS